MKRSRTHEDLRAALQQEGCAVCRLLEQDEQQFFTLLLTEQITDPAKREEIRRARGFCPGHMAALSRMQGAPLGSAILAQSILRLLLEELRSQPSSSQQRWGGLLPRLQNLRSHMTSLATLLRPQAPCPACVRLRERTDTYLSFLQESLQNEAFRAIYERSAGLCLPHLSLALRALAGHQSVEHLLTLQATIWSRMDLTLDELIRKHDHRFRHEILTDDERAIWRQAILIVSGERLGRDELS